jgi:hypothetical protein
MRALTDPDGSLVLTYDSAPWPKVLFVLTGLFAATAIYDLTIGSRGDDRLIGLIGAIATCGLMAVVVTESARVRISFATRTIEWRRMWAFRRWAGTVAFDEVQSIFAERSIASDTIPSRRIVLKTRDGRDIPFTQGYRPDGSDGLVRLAEQVRHLVGLADLAVSDDVLRSFLEDGRTIDAIKHLRETKGLSLVEAKHAVDDLMKPKFR